MGRKLGRLDDLAHVVNTGGERRPFSTTSGGGPPGWRRSSGTRRGIRGWPPVPSGPVQFRARAMMRAVVVLPRRGRREHEGVGRHGRWRKALRRVPHHRLLPDQVVEARGAVFSARARDRAGMHRSGCGAASPKQPGRPVGMGPLGAGRRPGTGRNMRAVSPPRRPPVVRCLQVGGRQNDASELTAAASFGPDRVGEAPVRRDLQDCISCFRGRGQAPLSRLWGIQRTVES